MQNRTAPAIQNPVCSHWTVRRATLTGLGGSGNSVHLIVLFIRTLEDALSIRAEQKLRAISDSRICEAVMVCRTGVLRETVQNRTAPSV